jgi:hypothetical protein
LSAALSALVAPILVARDSDFSDPDARWATIGYRPALLQTSIACENRPPRFVFGAWFQHLLFSANATEGCFIRGFDTTAGPQAVGSITTGQ